MRASPLVAASFVFFAAGSSFAQSAAAPPANPRAAAQESYAKGQRFYNAAEKKHDPALYEAAYLQFAQAYAIYPDDKVLWNLAASEHRTQRDVEALRHFRAYDRHQGVLARASHPDRAMLERFMSEARKATGHIVVGAPAGVRVQVDGADAALADDDGVDVVPGHHTVEATIDGKPRRVFLDVGAGETATASFTGIAAAQPSVPSVAATPAVTAAPTTTAAIAPGEHALSAPAPSDRGAEGSTTFFTAPHVTAMALFAVAAAGVGLAAGFGIDAGSKTDQANQLRSENPATTCAGGAPSFTCQELASLRSAHDSDRTMEAVFLASGAAFAVGGVATLLLWRAARPDVTRRAWILPVWTRSGAAVGLGSSF